MHLHKQDCALITEEFLKSEVNRLVISIQRRPLGDAPVTPMWYPIVKEWAEDELQYAITHVINNHKPQHGFPALGQLKSGRLEYVSQKQNAAAARKESEYQADKVDRGTQELFWRVHSAIMQITGQRPRLSYKGKEIPPWRPTWNYSGEPPSLEDMFESNWTISTGSPIMDDFMRESWGPYTDAKQKNSTFPLKKFYVEYLERLRNMYPDVMKGIEGSRARRLRMKKGKPKRGGEMTQVSDTDFNAMIT
jgi:hypothetical protein